MELLGRSAILCPLLFPLRNGAVSVIPLIKEALDEFMSSLPSGLAVPIPTFVPLSNMMLSPIVVLPVNFAT